MHPVKLYVYDLSNGMARQMSQQLLGRRIEGIWHTAVMVYGKEIFYGQGISTTAPGRSHHGRPHQVIDMGSTEIDEATFVEYLGEMRSHYTAEKYHLLDFNCNSFTNDVVGFLTGGAIPSWIRDLPADFLSTPFGQMLRPTIDQMFRGPGNTPPAATPPRGPSAGAVVGSLLQAAASRAASGQAQTLTSHLQISTNPSSFRSLLKSHRGTVAFFTSQTCAPCKTVEPVFEELARSKARQGGVAFVKVDLGVGLGGQVASEWGVVATPTFLFFKGDKKTSDLKGVNTPELRTQTDLLLYELFPPHPHAKLALPVIRAISLEPILFSKPPAYGRAQELLLASIESYSATFSNAPNIKDALSKQIVPALERRFPTGGASNPGPPLSPKTIATFQETTETLISTLTTSDTFPLVDFWRIGILDAQTAQSCTKPTQNPINAILYKVTTSLNSTDAVPRNFLLTALRLFTNCFANSALSQYMMTSARPALTSVLVSTLLHADGPVRTAAASLAFNIAAYVQKPLMEAARNGNTSEIQEDGSADIAEWTVEVASALVQALQQEKESEEVVHRLTASLAFLLHLSPWYTEHVAPLLEVLEAKLVLEDRVRDGSCVKKAEVKRLVEEVLLLCP